MFFYFQREPEAKGLRNKPFPLFDRLGYIFGKDRATGVAAETPADAMEDLDAGLNENITSEDVIPESVTNQASPPTHNAGRRKRKRNSDGWSTGLQDMANVLNAFVESNNKNFEAFNDNIRANCVSKNRKQVLEELNKMTSLNARDRVFLVRKIAEHADYVNIFLSMSEEERTEFVVQLLGEPSNF